MSTRILIINLGAQDVMIGHMISSLVPSEEARGKVLKSGQMLDTMLHLPSPMNITVLDPWKEAS
jgi:hypothetical protein